MPAGRLVLTQEAADGRLLLVGETGLHTLPVGAPIEIDVGESPDVIVHPRLVRRWTVGERARSEYELTATNPTKGVATFEIAYLFDAEDGTPRVISGRRGVERRFYGYVWSHRLRAGQTGVYRLTIEDQD